MHIYSYARYSTDRQTEASIVDQQRRCHQYAGSRGLAGDGGSQRRRHFRGESTTSSARLMLAVMLQRRHSLAGQPKLTSPAPRARRHGLRPGGHCNTTRAAVIA
jgi:hypothetical protein